MLLVPLGRCRTARLLCWPPTTLHRMPISAGHPCEAPWVSPRAFPGLVLGRAM